MVATAGYDRVIRLWDLESGEPVRDLKGHNGAIFDLAFSPDGQVLVSACADETVKVWNVATGARLDTLSQPRAKSSRLRSRRTVSMSSPEAVTIAFAHGV